MPPVAAGSVEDSPAGQGQLFEGVGNPGVIQQAVLQQGTGAAWGSASVRNFRPEFLRIWSQEIVKCQL